MKKRHVWICDNGCILEIDVKYMAEVPIDVQSRIDGIHKKEKYRMINIDVTKKKKKKKKTDKSIFNTGNKFLIIHAEQNTNTWRLCVSKNKRIT